MILSMFESINYRNKKRRERNNKNEQHLRNALGVSAMKLIWLGTDFRNS